MDYEILSFSRYGGGFGLSASAFALDPALVDQGWAGAFNVRSGRVTVNFSAIPEPSATVLLAAAGAALLGVRRLRKSSRPWREARRLLS